MLLEIRIVSRKTPTDGKLEITAPTAQRLAALGDSLRVWIGDRAAEGCVSSMACSCAKGERGAHEHHFLGSELLRDLTPDETVVLELTIDGELLVARPHPI